MSRHYLAFCHAGTPFYDLAPADTGRSTFAALDTPLPPDWELRAETEWTHVVPRDVPLIQQGWKIHISARPENAEHVLARTREHCLDHRLHFKVLSNPQVLSRRNAKDADRSGSGKFITIYPPDDGLLEHTLRELGAQLEGETGPRILSDLRWGSGPLYVRYGAFITEIIEDENGRIMHCLRDPDGNLVEDRRTPFFRPPAWAPMPEFLQEAVQARQEGVLTDFPFTVERALHFSNGGGVYRALHRPSGTTVLLKEARPLAGLDEQGRDAVTRQQQERWALEQLDGVAVIPPMVSHVHGHEHQFLAREFVEGVSLLEWVGQHHPMAQGREDERNVAAYTQRVGALIDQVSEGIAAMHARGVVFGDLHPGNIMITDDDKVQLIDLETATPMTEAAAQAFAAPGYRAPLGSSGPTLDRYALGCLRLAVFLPECPLSLDWNPQALSAVLEMIRARFPLPDGFEEQVRHDLGRPAENSTGAVLSAPGPESVEQDSWPLLRDRIAAWIAAQATPERTDRLFPGDAAQFSHPDAGLGLAHGAAGVLLTLHDAGLEVPTAQRDWLIDRTRQAPLLRPGLHEGLAGITEALDRLGAPDIAGDLAARLAPAAEKSADRSLWSGISGIGLALTSLAQRSGDSERLSLASEIARRLVDEPRPEELRRTGLLAGASGEGLFLIALHDLTGEDRWLHAAQSAVLHDVERAGVSRPAGAPLPSATIAETGGIALVARLLLDRGVTAGELSPFCDGAVDRSRASLHLVPGLLKGRVGELLVDTTLRPDQTHQALQAHLPALGVVAVDTPQGCGFLGEALLRLSCDLGTGAAGVLAVLDRIWGGDAATPLPPHLYGTGTTPGPARS